MLLLSTVSATALAASALSRPAVSDVRGEDPAPLRLELLAAMDAEIDRVAAESHIAARMMLDRTMPVAFLGIVPVAESDGLRITQVYRESGADAAGIRVGDVMLSFGGERTTDKEALYRDIRRFAPGASVDVHVRRDGRELQLRATLGQRWQEDEEDEEQYVDLAQPPFVARGLPASLDLAATPSGTAPPRIEQVLGGLGTAPGFVAQRVDESPVLRQSAPDELGIHFPMALLEGVDADDVVGRVRFRLVAGAQDRTAGIVLHWRGPHDYLVARANAVEGDLRIFRTVNGMRRTLPGAVAQVSIDDDRWHTLEFRAEGPRTTAVLDDEVTVSSYDTYFQHGRVGLWTKSDAVTDFADVSFEAP